MLPGSAWPRLMVCSAERAPPRGDRRMLDFQSERHSSAGIESVGSPLPRVRVARRKQARPRRCHAAEYFVAWMSLAKLGATAVCLQNGILAVDVFPPDPPYSAARPGGEGRKKAAVTMRSCVRCRPARGCPSVSTPSAARTWLDSLAPRERVRMQGTRAGSVARAHQSARVPRWRLDNERLQRRRWALRGCDHRPAET